MDALTLKICTKCKIPKPLVLFGNSKASKDGKKPRCLECSRTDWQDYAMNRQDKEARKTYYKGYVALNRPHIAARMQTYDAMRKAQGLRDHQLYPERTRARSKQYYADHAEAFKTYRNTHQEERAQNYARWSAENAEHLAEYQGAHREETRARGRKWTRDFPEKNAAKEARRRAKKANLPDTWTQEQLTFMLTYWQQSCAACGNMRGLLWTLAHDHWIPINSPDCPGTVATNMIPLCHGNGGCNNSKNDTEPHVWLLKRFGTKKAAKIKEAIAQYFQEVAHAFPEASGI